MIRPRGEPIQPPAPRPPVEARGWNPPTLRLGYLTKMFPRISETFILDEVRALRSSGVPVTIYSLLPPTRDARSHPEATALSARNAILPQPGWRALPILGAALRSAFRAAPGRAAAECLRFLVRPTRRSFRHFFRGVVLAERLRRDDVVHLHAAWAHTPASVALIASRLTGIPWSMAAHAKDIHLARPESLAAKLRSAEFTLACTSENQRHLKALAACFPGAEPPRIEMIHHGIDVEYFRPEEAHVPGLALSALAPPLILSIGRLVRKKGFDVLLEAAALLRDRGISFHVEIVGEGPLRSSLEKRISQLGLGGMVRLSGIAIRSEVRQALRRANCFVLPSRVAADGDRDGIPNTLAEAMACCLPVVSSKLPSIEELVEDGKSGILVAPEDAGALSSALEKLLDDSALCDQLGAAARRRVVESFDARRSRAERVERLARNLSPRKILYVTADRGVPVGGSKGASVHVRSLVRAWKQLDVESRILTTNPGSRPGHEAPVPVYEARAGRRGERLARRLARWLGGSRELERALLRLADNAGVFRAGLRLGRAWRPDFVYERYSLTAVAGHLLARRLGVPHILEVNAPLAREEARYRGLRLGSLARFLEGWILRHADRVIVVSRALEEHARRQGVRPERIAVLPNGVDGSIFHPGCDGRAVRARFGLEEALVVGFAGTLKPWHGVHHLVRAFAGAVPVVPELRLLVMGDGPERESLAALANDCGIAEYVHFVGAVPHDRMGEHLAACDVLCAPYGPMEDFYFSPLKLSEYRAVGRPVVATTVGELASLAREPWAITIPPGDEEELARALIELARDPDQRGSLARAASESAPWSWTDVAEHVLAEAQAVRIRKFHLASAAPLVVAYVLKMFPRFSETFILNEILALERLGARVAIFSMRTPNEAARQPGVADVRAPVRILPERSAAIAPLLGSHLASLLRSPRRYGRTLVFAASRRSRSAWVKFLYAPYVATRARLLGVEQLHAHFASGPARLAKFASMLSGIPFGFTAHAKDLFWDGHEHGRNHKLKKRVRMASFVVTISEYNRRFIEGLGFKVPRRRLVTVYNGLDLASWKWRGTVPRPVHGSNGASRDSRPLLLAVGRLVEKKGFHVLIEACGLLRDRGVQFRCAIAGDGPERRRLRDRIRTAHLDRHVELLGPVPQDRLTAELYSQASALVQPCVVGEDGDQDGIPMVILEAMAVGLPVITTPISGIGEAVEDGETGLLVNPGDASSLADAMERILSDPWLAGRLAATSRRRIERLFDLERNARLLLHLMTSSARGTRRWSNQTLRVKAGLESERDLGRSAESPRSEPESHRDDLLASPAGADDEFEPERATR